jgi:hypothetical protein
MEEKKIFADQEVFEVKCCGHLVAMGHKITNVPLILKNLGDYFLFLGKLVYGPFLGIF